MLVVLLKYWQIIAGAAGAFALAWMLHSLDINRIETKQRAALAAQEAILIAVCETNKAITTGISNDYQSKISDLNNKLAAAKRLHPSKCITVSVASPAGGRNAAAGGTQPAGAYGVASDALYDFAGEAEKYRLQLIGCQNFVEKVWAAH